MEQDSWKYIIINGKSQWLKVKNPTYEKGILSSIEDLKPFDKKKEDGTPIEPTLEDAQLEKRRIYSDFFKKAFKNILVLSGAGSSMDVGGLSMAQLWNKAEEKYNEKNPKGFKTICDAVNYKYEDKDLEKLLSQIEGFCKFSKDSKIKVAEDDEETPLSVIKEELFTLIKTLCTISEPESNFPHKILLEKLLQRKQTNPRVKIFTLNYDLLFEKAATAVNAIVIDGFSFTFPRTFSGRYFDYDIVQREGSKLKEEDNFIHRVFHLHKLHGSINWERNEENNSVEIHANPKRALMVYPREAKYEDSYEQPFFEMMARFQRNLRLNNDTLLICVGYSFNDKHINAAIEEALNQNPGFRLAVIDPGFDNDNISNSSLAIKKSALESERILMISESFTDFAKFYPEIKTYEINSLEHINLKND
ncbi:MULTISPECIES: SIR2 family protein [Mesonia]|uniref:Uncharacterized protein n=1 Tax=Mesonia oceanica TaxID=2687242 RepID=A0AC61YE50_9FLAO|nr:MULTISPECIES: SIR2 family protein [Mesonia]MAN29334.1 SIR2 family protein [Mesonia sp.]MAQ40906.1 SIR2 family protein [Mesonia sp.]MBJ98373.1 SIR2 family protein [Flavobacteriaceae bacterium]VVV02270.1 hypothetical protein FVB9532_03568 [Mesonia oceanica]|tara:strand:+ start:2582 stop:3838 length:1257 start_codon:yes stop_codon:yes gene_type:complete